MTSSIVDFVVDNSGYAVSLHRDGAIYRRQLGAREIAKEVDTSKLAGKATAIRVAPGGEIIVLAGGALYEAKLPRLGFFDQSIEWTPLPAIDEAQGEPGRHALSY